MGGGQPKIKITFGLVSHSQIPQYDIGLTPSPRFMTSQLRVRAMAASASTSQPARASSMVGEWEKHGKQEWSGNTMVVRDLKRDLNLSDLPTSVQTHAHKNR